MNKIEEFLNKDGNSEFISFFGSIIIWMLLLVFFNPILMLFILFTYFLYCITDKQFYSELLESDLISETYLNYRKNQIKRNIEKYNINEFDILGYKYDREKAFIVKERGCEVKIFQSPFSNCQTCTIAKFQDVIFSSDQLWKNVKDIIENKIGKNQVVVDIKTRYVINFDEFAIKNNLKDIEKMKYISTNGNSMTIIKFVI